MKRKLLLLSFIVLSIICAVCFVGCNANASVDKDDNPNADPFTQTDTTPSNGITYIAKSDGTYMVTNFSATSTDKNIVIASEHNGVPVTAIGNNAFENKNIESVVIPASITYIDSFAFFNCRKLRTVTFAENSKLQTIEHSAFLQCFALDNVVIPQGTIAIKDRAFRLCNSLKNISIPDSIKDMGIKVFDKCISLELITYENASYIGNQANPYLVLIDAAKNEEGAFATECKVNPACVVIADGAFYNNVKLATIEFGENLKYIGNHAFYRCTELTAITLGNNIEEIGEYSFTNCSELLEVAIGKNLKKIGIFSFSNSQKLAEFVVDAENANYQSIDGHIYSKDLTVLVRYASGSEDSLFSIPSHVTRIENGAFSYSFNLIEVIVSPSVTWVGDMAFLVCYYLEIIRFQNSEAYLGNYTLMDADSITDVYFAGTKEQLDAATARANWKYDINNNGSTSYTIHYGK